jgi:magnesium chelatase family protein
MSFAKVYSAQPGVLSARIIDVEVDISRGLNAFAVVGLGDKSVEEAKDRISSAIKNSGFKSPKQSNHKVVISLAPADLRKEGPIFDLAMAIAYLIANGDFGELGGESDGVARPDFSDTIFLGELSLDGKLRKVTGALAVTAEAQKNGYKKIFLPKGNAREASLVSGLAIFGAESLIEVIEHLRGDTAILKEETGEVGEKAAASAPDCATDFADVVGQESAKRGLVIAAAGGHNLAMYGPPGTGKTMLAKAFANILPPLSFDEIIETTSIHSVSGILKSDRVTSPPIRSPHHTASYVALVGGGNIPRPGEITLAHRGVLFLDEFTEFDRNVLEALREPLEERKITITRAKGATTFPANFILLAAMNPCPCGYRGSKVKECICRVPDLIKYQRKISGPIIDRIDMWVEVSQVAHRDLINQNQERKTAISPALKQTIINARSAQTIRFSKLKTAAKTNAEMSAQDINKIVKLSAESKKILDSSAEKLALSPRAYHKVIKLAQTIADLDQKGGIGASHILEALQYRPKNQII